VLLAFDTATAAITVAVADVPDGPAILAETTTVDPRRHGELLAVGIDEVLRKAGVTAADLRSIAVGVGPGPFTGLRVGVVTARAMGAALGIPVVGVCTLDVLAHAGRLPGEFLVVTDARRKEVYWARYGPGGTRIDGPQVNRPADVAYNGPVVGAGATLYPAAFPDPRPPEYPSAAALCEYVASGAPTLGPLPLYLRRPDIAEPGARKRVS
jgi:tRNA threonylcarbamoyladenosine biosynthesis protein TsaB